MGQHLPDAGAAVVVPAGGDGARAQLVKAWTGGGVEAVNGLWGPRLRHGQARGCGHPMQHAEGEERGAGGEGRAGRAAQGWATVAGAQSGQAKETGSQMGQELRSSCCMPSAACGNGTSRALERMRVDGPTGPAPMSQQANTHVPAGVSTATRWALELGVPRRHDPYGHLGGGSGAAVLCLALALFRRHQRPLLVQHVLHVVPCLRGLLLCVPEQRGVGGWVVAFVCCWQWLGS